MDKRVLVVFGATGTQGRATIQHFLNTNHQKQWIIKGTTRDVTSPAAQALQALGAVMVFADLNDVQSLHQVLAGATHVFANTDSNRIIQQASENPDVLDRGETATTFAKKIELLQGKNLLAALIADASLERVVWSSLTSPKKWSRGRFTKVTMFDAKEEIGDLLRNETTLHDKLSILLVGFYADNALRVPELYAPQRQRDGSYVLELPMRGNVLVPFAHVQGDIGKWVDTLFNVPPGLTLVGASDYHTWDQWIRAWGDANGVQAVFHQISASEFGSRKKGIGEAVAEEFRFVDEYGFTGGNVDVITVEGLKQYRIMLEGTSYERYIESCDWSKITRSS